MHGYASKLLLATLSLLCSCNSVAAEIRVAVASNFSRTITSITERFQANTHHTVKLSFASTGKHYAQIMNGAPFDIFLAADERRPRLLEQQGLAVTGTRFTYAIGKLVLWSPMSNYVDSQGRVMENRQFRHLAIANPKLAPYGKAAQQVLQARGIWEKLKGKIVRGENIGQTFQFVKSGNAELGFVAYSQLKYPQQPIEGSYWQVPSTLYSPIEQQAVLLRDNETVRAFLGYVRSDEALKIIHEHGYDTP